MSEIIKKRLAENVGEDVLIFRYQTGWRYFGKIVSVDETHVEIYDYKKGAHISIPLNQIETSRITSKKRELSK